MNTVEKDAYAYLTITSDHLTLDAISDFLEMAPDGKSWSLGDARKTSNNIRPKYEFSKWSLNSGALKGERLETHFEALCLRMAPLSSKLRKLPKEMQAQISITGWVDSYADQLCLSAGILREIGAFGLPLDFDFYSKSE